MEKFSFYLAGLIEGDGTIIVPKTEKTKNRLNYPFIQIIFHLKDLALALLIQKELKQGSLCRKKGVNAYVLTINSYQGLLDLINLINGKMRTPKLYSFNNLIDWYNKKYPELNIKKYDLDVSSLAQNFWLSGFLEADGHFQVTSSLVGKYPRIECRFELSQRQIDHKGYDNLIIVKDIGTFLN